MTDPIAKSDDHPSANHDVKVRDTSPRPFLRMRPTHFFSNKFNMDIVESYSKKDAEEENADRPNGLSRLIDLNLLLMILVIGVPVLVYCIVALAR